MVGWRDFEEEKMLHILCCAKLLLDPNSKLSSPNDTCFLGCRASEKFALLDCYPNLSPIFFVKHNFEASDRGERIL